MVKVTKMKKKIVVLGLLSVLIFSGLPAFTAMGYEAQKINQADTNGKSENAYDQTYPDLIPILYFKQNNEKDYYDIFVGVQNIGDGDAFFSAGEIIVRVKSIYKILPKPVETEHSNTSDTTLRPGEIYEDYAGSDYKINLKGAKFIVTADPNNVTYEGVDGEKNNVLEETVFPRTRHNTFSLFSRLIWILKQYPNSFQLLRNLLGIR